MIIFKKAADLASYLQDVAAPVAFVPTMGALHTGHRSLLDLARADGCFTVCSVFVNPTQFNDPDDFKKYPTSPEADAALLLDAGCDVLFLPSVDEIYPQGSAGTKAYDFGFLEAILEGAQRPGHFRGVGQVVGRLLEIVRPQFLYMGQKDYQQCLIVKALLRMMPGGKEITLVIGSTVREADGLAMSSRNRRLTEPQRALAGVIYQCLVSVQSKHGLASFAQVVLECNALLKAKGFQPEYVALADADTLELLADYPEDRKAVALIAARLGSIRLIDNLLLAQDSPASKSVAETHAALA